MEKLGIETAQGAKARSAYSKSERAYIETENAIQWLARVAWSYGSAPAEDIRLSFDPATGRVTTPEIAPGTSLSLHLPRLVFQFEQGGKPTPHSLDLDDRSTTEVEAWLLAELLHRGFDRDRFDKHLPYEWSHPMSGDEVKYSSHDLAHELDRLTQRLTTAATCLIEAKNGLETKRPSEAPGCAVLVFWPRWCSIGFSGPDERDDVRVFFVLNNDSDNVAYRVTDSANRALSIEIVASENASSKNIVRQIIDAAEHISKKKYT